MTSTQRRMPPRIAVIGLVLSVVAFAGELVIVLVGSQNIGVYVVGMIACGLPLLLLHLAGTICGVMGAVRARRHQLKSSVAVLAILAGLFGLPLTTALVLYAGLIGASAWH